MRSLSIWIAGSAVTRERVRQIELRALKKLRRLGPVDIRA